MTPSHRLSDIRYFPSMHTSAFLDRLGWKDMHCMCYMDLLLLFCARTYSIIWGVEGDLDWSPVATTTVFKLEILEICCEFPHWTKTLISGWAYIMKIMTIVANFIKEQLRIFPFWFDTGWCCVSWANPMTADALVLGITSTFYTLHLHCQTNYYFSFTW